MRFTMEEIINFTETWIVKGELNPDMLADNFQFISPFWRSNNKTAFLEKFLDPAEYIRLSLSNITKFDPYLNFKGLDGKHFSMILQYFTKNGGNVWEAVLGKVEDGMLVELRSIYDLEATKKANELK
jgi:hypothetical protein